MTPLSVEARTLLRLLDDGEWHLWETICAQLAATVPPGKALRRYDRRNDTRREREGPRVKAELSMVEKIASGQRMIANVSMNSLKVRYIEFMDSLEGRMVRRRPQAAPMWSPAEDEDAAPLATAGPHVAFFSEEQVRALLADELAKGLAAFSTELRDLVARAQAGGPLL